MKPWEKAALVIIILAIIATSGILIYKPFPDQKKAWIRNFISKDAGITNDDMQEVNKFLKQCTPTQLKRAYSLGKANHTITGMSAQQTLANDIHNMLQGQTV